MIRLGMLVKHKCPYCTSSPNSLEKGVEGNDEDGLFFDTYVCSVCGNPHEKYRPVGNNELQKYIQSKVEQPKPIA
jgi:hypothetical protein